MAKKSIFSSFLEGGAMALYAASKKGDLDLEDQMNADKAESSAEDLKKRKYMNQPIGPNALDVPEDTPNEFASGMVGMAAKKAAVGIAQQKVTNEGVRVGAYAEGKKAQADHWRALEGIAGAGNVIKRFNAATARINATTNQGKALDTQTHNQVTALTTTAQKYINLMNEARLGNDTTAVKVNALKAVQAAEQAAKIASSYKGTVGASAPVKPKKMPDSIWQQYSKLGPNGQAAFKRDNSGYFD